MALVTACVGPADEPGPAPVKPVAADKICGGMFGSETGRDLQRLLTGRKEFHPRTRSEEEIDFYFGWTRHPYSTDEEKSKTLDFTVGDAERTRAVDDLRRTTARFPCRLPNGHDGAVQGYFEGYWDNDLDDVTAQSSARLRVLLSAASKVSTSLGCTNRPRLSPSGVLTRR
ncbi:hypothetical protein [Streptomyces sp. NPDC056628]|uniref:hypothetical protein n=1 Tax=Streptomyces sp. NPDC056628 TaxID=3345882 RepID=UPI0036A493EA